MSTTTLQQIRAKVKAPKSEYNDFGHYHYRTKASILEAVKPVLNDHKALLEFKDRPVTVNDDSIFIESEAKLTIEGDENVYKAYGYALHAKELKGMQPAQVTGATTSYAQKAALEALFLIDSATTIDEMKPTITVEKEVKPAEVTRTSAPVSSSAKTAWLNLGTKEYVDALTDLKMGKTTLDKIKLIHKVSRAVEAKLIEDFNSK